MPYTAPRPGGRRGGGDCRHVGHSNASGKYTPEDLRKTLSTNLRRTRQGSKSPGRGVQCVRRGGGLGAAKLYITSLRKTQFIEVKMDGKMKQVSWQTCAVHCPAAPSRPPRRRRRWSPRRLRPALHHGHNPQFPRSGRRYCRRHSSPS